ncbi:MAG: hypothetical protein LC798_15575 [Chloroflexi bacterium]|nr:hypothetical protein [Chloroflexota bacterium]
MLTTPAHHPPTLEPLSAALARSRSAAPACAAPVNGSLTRESRLRKRSPRILETPDIAAMLRRMIAAHGRRCATDDVEGWLPEFLALHEAIDAAGAHAVTASHEQHGRSWADIGAAAGTSKQAAAQRWS